MLSFRIYYIVILLFLFITFVFAHYYFTFVLLVAFLLLPIFTFIIALINKFNIDITLNSRNDVHDNKTNYFISLKNKSIFPIAQCNIKVELYNKFFDTTEIRYIKCPIQLRDTIDINMEFIRDLCGVYNFNITEIKVIDYLGIFSLYKRIKDIGVSDIYVGMIPTVSQKEEFISEFYDADSNRYSPTKKGDDNTEIFQIREYQNGDDIRKVHWKLSMVHDKTMIKDYSLPVSIGLFIFLDIKNNNEVNANRKSSITVQLFISLMYGLIENGAICTVIYYDTISNSMVQKRVDSDEIIFEIVGSVLMCNYNNYVFESENINVNDKNINNIIYLTTKTDYNNVMLDRISNITFVSSSENGITLKDDNNSHKFIHLNENNIVQVANDIFDML